MKLYFENSRRVYIRVLKTWKPEQSFLSFFLFFFFLFSLLTLTFSPDQPTFHPDLRRFKLDPTIPFVDQLTLANSNPRRCWVCSEKPRNCRPKLEPDARTMRPPDLPSLPCYVGSFFRPASISNGAPSPIHRRSVRKKRNHSSRNQCELWASSHIAVDLRPGRRPPKLSFLSSPRAETSSWVHLDATFSSRHQTTNSPKTHFHSDHLHHCPRVPLENH